jgi:hypothetical protein
MTVVGVTGHQGLDSETRELVAAELRSVLEDTRPLRGIGSLAEGADQIFAEVVLSVGGTISAVIPAAGYEGTFEGADTLGAYRRLLAHCEEVIELPFHDPGEEAFWAAGQEVVRRAELVVAVWDGEPAAGLGGTADVVAFAESIGRPVRRVWPLGARR